MNFKDVKNNENLMKQGIINNSYISILNKKTSLKDPDKQYYKNLIYCNKKFYLMNKHKNAFNNNILNYYYINNNTTRKSKKGVRHSICKCHIKYDKTKIIIYYLMNIEIYVIIL